MTGLLNLSHRQEQHIYHDGGGRLSAALQKTAAGAVGLPRVAHSPWNFWLCIFTVTHNPGGGVSISALWIFNIIGRFIMNGGTIRTCTGLETAVWTTWVPSSYVRRDH